MVAPGGGVGGKGSLKRERSLLLCSSMKTFPRLLSQTLALIATLAIGISCQKPTGAPMVASDQSNVTRIDGVTEPPELLIPGEKPHPVTEEAKAFGKVLEGIKAGHEAAGLPALDAFISAHSPGRRGLHHRERHSAVPQEI